MAEWSDFFVAQAGASTALAGLIFAAISTSLTELLQFRHLVIRAAVALILLVSVLVMSSLLLAPNQSTPTAGIEILVVSISTWLITRPMASTGSCPGSPAASSSPLPTAGSCWSSRIADADGIPDSPRPLLSAIHFPGTPCNLSSNPAFTQGENG